MKICEQCQKEFQGNFEEQRFCNQGCAGAFTAKHRTNKSWNSGLSIRDERVKGNIEKRNITMEKLYWKPKRNKFKDKLLGIGYVLCPLCGDNKKYRQITKAHLKSKHSGIDYKDFCDKYQTICRELSQQIGEITKRIFKNHPEVRKQQDSARVKTMFNNREKYGEANRKRAQSLGKRNKLYSFPHKLLKETMLESKISGFETECIVEGYSVDECNKELKIVIFVDGDFWHGNPKFYKSSDKIISNLTVKIRRKKDKEITKYFKDKNYKVLRFWECDIKKNVSQIIKIIQETVQRLKYTKRWKKQNNQTLNLAKDIVSSY